MSECIKLLTAATTAIRDRYVGFPDDEIVAPSGMGIKTLLRDLVTYLRENGIDDEGSWNCDVTEGIEVRKVPTFEPFTLVVEARTTNEFGEGPDYAEIRVTPEFIERLLRFSRLCKEHGSILITTSDIVDRWNREDEFRIGWGSMQVRKDTFWFEAYPKHASYSVETAVINIANLVSVAVLSTESAYFRRVGDRVFYVDNDDLNGLIARYEDDCEND